MSLQVITLVPDVRYNVTRIVKQRQLKFDVNSPKLQNFQLKHICYIIKQLSGGERSWLKMLGGETSWSETSRSETSRSKKSRAETSWARNIQVQKVQGRNFLVQNVRGRNVHVQNVRGGEKS